MLALFLAKGAAGQQSSLQFFKNYFLTGGDYAAAAVGLAGQGVDGVAGGTITIERPGDAPADSEVVAAFLYWQVVTKDGPDGGALGVKFNGIPLETPSTLPGIEGGPLGQALTLAGTSPCWSSGGGTGGSGGPKLTYTYRADVLRFLPIDPETGRHDVFDRGMSVEVPDSGSNGNGTPIALGAALVVVFRDPHPNAAMSSIVFYDGGYTMNNAAPSMEQAISGFYDPTPDVSQAKLTHIVGSGQSNKIERLRLMYGNDAKLTVANPFGGDTGLETVTFAGLPTPASSNVLVKTVVDDGGSGSGGDCLNWGAVIYRTPVQDQDRDGLLDLWERQSGLTDPNGEELPDLRKMGAHPERPDVFLELGYLYAPDETAYGSTLAGAHTHLPAPAALKLLGEAFSREGISVHFDAGGSYGDARQKLLLGYEAGEDPAADLPDACKAENPNAPPDPAAACMVAGSESRGGDSLEESVTVCERDPLDPPWVCQFSGYPGTVGWKSGFRFFRDGPVDSEGCRNAVDPDSDPACRPKFDRARKDTFRYALFAHALGLPKESCLDDDPTTPELIDEACMETNPDFHVPVTNTGVADFPGGDLLIALGGFKSETGLPVGSTYMQASTPMHELGHTFNRGHAGDSIDSNCHPNYLSVMNYLFQLRGLVDSNGDAQVDFSGQVLQPLTEANLSELEGLKDAGGVAPPYHTAWYAPLDDDDPSTPPSLPTQLGLPTAQRYCSGAEFGGDDPMMVRLDATGGPGNPLDWNGDGDVSDLGVQQDINLDGPEGTATLQGANDWANLRLDQAGIRRNVGSWYVIEDPATGEFLAYIGPSSLDFGRGDLGRGDLGRGDLGRGDLGRGDLGRGDLGRGDLGRGDLGRGDLGRGDLGRGDLGRGDLGRGDLGRGDLGRGDLGDGNLVDMSAELATALGSSPPNSAKAVVSRIGCPPEQDPESCHRIALSWKPPHVGVVTHYLAYRARGSLVLGQDTTIARIPFRQDCSSDPDSQVLEIPETSLSIVDCEELPDNVAYTYYVRAEFEEGPGSGLSNPAQINAENQAPAAVDDAYQVFAGGSLVIAAPGVLSNDTDVDSPTLTAELVLDSGPAYGSLMLDEIGSFVYEPNPGFVGVDAFQYTANDIDPSRGSNAATVTITVDGYGFEPLKNLPPRKPFENSGSAIPFEWRFTMDGQAVDSTDFAPEIIITGPDGSETSMVFTPEDPGFSSFREPTESQGWVWGFSWKTSDVSGAPLPAGDYAVQVKIGKTGQLFPEGDKKIVITLR